MLDIIIDARQANLGNHFSVRRILPYRLRRMLGPFIFMDHAGPVSFSADQIPNMDVLPHPHIGLSTVSYLFNGQVTHRDSLGVEQVIRPGEVNWMTAGKGIAHSERFEDPATLAGGSLEMIQTWVALPTSAEEDDPSFTNYQPQELPIFTDKGIWMRLIAGEAFGLKNEVKTHSPLFYVHVVLQTGTRFGLPLGYAERGIYVAKGSIEVNGHRYGIGQLLVFSAGIDPVIIAQEASTVMMLGGEHLGERYIWWNFVSSSKERIEQAKADWMAGRIPLPPNDHAEFIPLPEDRSKPAGATPPPPPLS
ncbi:pirin family protein [Siphonobacter sp. SORGH_AS_0500]|uniref:pirin family protein n=1 Tax=Siphonobacter sp. SORGH_AS_0500 TaxID=1864824 RepID=UPI00285750F6|nr:pirin family protein [Siphonobacter sp. SORGH_AS_0500]MDR6197748.1 redox-sensitive bicupin YhaK (pirin superfamily) [Siphonobacter sp. SORGH_AS_0500]